MERNAVLDWLLAEDNPPVRLLTLTRLLHYSETSSVVNHTRSRLMSYDVTEKILLHADEIWNSGPRAFWSFKGKNWNTVFLGHFMADGHDPLIATGVQQHLDHSWTSKKWQCMTASMLTAFRRLGYGEHPVVIESIQTLAQRVLDDGGVTCPGMNTSLMTHCYMSLPKLLLCFAEIPPEQRTTEVDKTVQWIVKQLVDHQVYLYLPGNRKAWDAVRPRSHKRSDYPEGETPISWWNKMKVQFVKEHGLGDLEPKQIWTRFGFPLNYNSDILEAMYALATAGTPMNKRLEKPIQIIKNKRTTDGVWLMDKSLNGQMWADVEEKGEPSKWITLFALIVLDHFRC
jgi:hypothetical protein